MKITNEAVQAFKNEFHENSPKRSYDENIKSSLSAALPHLPLGFEVKQLVWSEYDDEQSVPDRWDAEAASFGVFYSIELHHDRFRVIFDHEDVGAIGSFQDLDEAKAAAQADFERRVRECITLTNEDTKPVDVAAVREQCAQIAKSWEETAINLGQHVEASIANDIKLSIRAMPAEPALKGQQHDK